MVPYGPDTKAPLGMFYTVLFWRLALSAVHHRSNVIVVATITWNEVLPTFQWKAPKVESCGCTDG